VDRSGFWQQPDGWRLAAKVATKLNVAFAFIAHSRSSIVKGLYERAAPDLSKILNFLNRPAYNQARRAKFERGIQTKTIFVERSELFATY